MSEAIRPIAALPIGPIVALLGATLIALLFAIGARIVENGATARTDAADKKAQAKLTAAALGDPYDVEETPDEPTRAEGALSLADAVAILRVEAEVLKAPEQVRPDVVIAEVIAQGDPVPDAEAVPPVTLALEIDHPKLPAPSYTDHLPKHLHAGARAAEAASHTDMTGWTRRRAMELGMLDAEAGVR